MKAVKYFAFYLSLAVFAACKPKEQAKHSLHQTTKDYFEVRNGSKYYFTEASDTNLTIEYTAGNYVNQQANPDIENSEILVYDLSGAAKLPTYTIRCETGGSEFKDRIALIVKSGDTSTLGAVVFNQGGNFTTIAGTGDSLIMYPAYVLNGKLFNDVIRIKLFDNPLYREIFYAKGIGLIGRKEKAGDKFFYLKRYQIQH